MAISTEAGLTTERLAEVSQLVKRAGDEAVRLRIVERFLSEVERRLLKMSPQVFDIERIRAALQILKSLTADDEIDECLEAEFRLDQEFDLWRELIVKRDERIETYHFRRLCDSAPYPLDDEVFLALAGFYKSLPLTSATQSKFDLSVTRLFTRAVSHEKREIRSFRSETVRRLKELFPSRSASFSEAVTSAVGAIDGFIDEALSLTDFEDLVAANLFDRYRAFKRELGALFFEPDVIAAAIECNVVVGNVFNDLLQTADDQLGKSLTVDVDIAGALHDPAPQSRSHVNELFRVFFGDADASNVSLSDEVHYLGKLLDRSSGRDEALTASSHAQSTASTVQGRIAPILKTLSEAEPDIQMLLTQMQQCEISKSAELNDFLYAADGEPDVLCRRALGVIIWSVRFIEVGLEPEHSRDLIRREATSLLTKSESLAAKLRNEIEVSDELNESRLRAVLNALLDARLKLERAIVRFTDQTASGELQKPADETDNAQDKADVQETNQGSNYLTTVLAILLVAGLIVYLYTQGFFNELISIVNQGK